MTEATAIESIRRIMVGVGIPKQAAAAWEPQGRSAEAILKEGSSAALKAVSKTVFRIDGIIDDPIGEAIDELWQDDSGLFIGPRAITEFLAEAEGEDVTFLINTPGGSVYGAADIVAQLDAYEGRCTARVVGLAASAGSIIAAACDEVLMTPMGQVMIHAPNSYCRGTAKDLRAEADNLDRIAATTIPIYARRIDEALATDLLADCEDHYFTAKEAIDINFAEGMAEPMNAGGDGDGDGGDDAPDPDGGNGDGDPPASAAASSSRVTRNLALTALLTLERRSQLNRRTEQ